MKVKEVMTEQPAAVWITDSLASAAISMWENDCGILPILKDDRKVVGLITDRDICMAPRSEIGRNQQFRLKR